MLNKNIYLKIQALSLLGLILSLFLIYFKNFKQYPVLTNLSTNKVFLIKNKIKNYFITLENQILSISDATRYKLQLLNCKASLNQLRVQSQIKNIKPINNNKLQILAINWPEIGYITLNNPNQNNTGILVDNNNILIGKIIRHTNNLLIIKTIFAPNFQIPVYLKKSKAYGILKNLNGNIIITNISITHKIYPNDTVYVLLVNYPLNIIVGKLQNKLDIKNNSAEPFRTIKVTTFYKDISNLQDINSMKIINENTQ